jgi:hypothetical protein
MSGEQKIRAVLFYVSVLVFVFGLPMILSYTIGLRFDPRTLKFTRTGINAIKTVPAGAAVILDGKPISEKTPTSINELLPGTYRLELTLEGHYPYTAEITVSEAKVTRLEKVILFPLRPDIKQLNKEKVNAFWFDELRGAIYYVDLEANALYRSDLEGNHFSLVCSFIGMRPAPKGWEFSAGRERLLYYNSHQIGIIQLVPEAETPAGESMFVLNYPQDSINRVFWHQDGYHLIVAGARRIAMMEAQPGSQTFTLASLNKRNSVVSYDARNDALYFMDAQKAEDGTTYENTYKLELKSRLFPFQELEGLIRRKNNDRE